MRISDWSSDVCSSDLRIFPFRLSRQFLACPSGIGMGILVSDMNDRMVEQRVDGTVGAGRMPPVCAKAEGPPLQRSEEHTSELQSLMRISYAVFCSKKKKHTAAHHR